MAKDWGKALEGAGAWFAGQGPQWENAQTMRERNRLLDQQMLQESAAAAEKERQRKMATQWRQMYSYGKAGLWDEVGNIAQTRISELASEGLDPTHTVNFASMLAEARDTGDWSKVDGKWKVAEQAAIDDGLLKAMPSNTPQYEGYTTDENGNRWALNQSTGKMEMFDTGGARFKANEGTTVNVNNTPEGAGLTEEQKQLAKDRVSYYGQLRDQSNTAMQQNQQLSMLEKVDINTGFGVEARKNAAKVTNFMFGEGAGDIFQENIPAVEAFQALADDIVNGRVSLEKGPQTDQDIERFRRTMASLGKTPEANQFLISMMKARNDRIIEKKNFYQGILKNKGSLEDADELWTQYMMDTPLLSTVITDNKTGLPMFFSEFKRQTKLRNPKATQEQILDAWRELND